MSPSELKCHRHRQLVVTAAIDAATAVVGGCDGKYREVFSIAIDVIDVIIIVIDVVTVIIEERKR